MKILSILVLALRFSVIAWCQGSGGKTEQTPAPAVSSQTAKLPECSGSAFDLSYCDAVSPSPYPNTAVYRTVTVCASGCAYRNVQAALKSTGCGTVISVAANRAAINSPITYDKRCEANHWIIVRSDAPDSSLPPITQRLQPYAAHSKSLAALVNSGDGATTMLTIAPSASYLWIGPGIDISVEDTRRTWAAGGGVITANTSPRSADDLPNHIVIDRSWVHGKTDNSLYTQGVEYFFATHTIIQNSVIDHINSGPATGQGGSCQTAGGCAVAIDIGFGGPHKIYNNYLFGAGMEVFLEPQANTPASLASSAVAQDITISRNLLTKDGLRRGLDQVANAIEYKMGLRVLVEGNIVEGSWVPFQVGHLVAINPDCGFYGPPTSVVAQDLTFRKNIFRMGRVGIDITAGDYGQGKGTSHCASPHTIVGKISIVDNLWYDLGQAGQYGWWLRLARDDRFPPRHDTINDLEVRHNTVIPNPKLSLAQNLSFNGVDASSGLILKDNILPQSSYFCSSVRNPDGGAYCFFDVYNPASVDANAFVGSTFAQRGSWPKTWGDRSCGSSHERGRERRACSYWFEEPRTYKDIGLADSNNCGQGNKSTSACAIVSGPLHHGASDGTDVGANIAAVDAATAHSSDGQW